MNIYDSQIEKMKSLMNYGNEENTTHVNKAIVEHSSVGADGKKYAIIRENNKYYIKSAPQKNTETLAEDYDYLGGFLNRKNYEYDSYSKASKEFELKLMSINEAYSSKKPIEEEYKNFESSEWSVNESDEMKNEIRRQKEIMRNASLILNEDSHIPDAPASNPSEKTVNQPFTDNAKATLDKDFTKTSDNHETVGSPFNKKENVTDKDMEDDSNKKGGDDVNSPNTEKPKYAPKNSVAAKKMSGGKAVKMNEAKKVRFTESQVLSWNDCDEYMDKSHGTEIGDSQPFCDKSEIKEGESMHDKSDNINVPKPGVSNVGDSQPFNKKVNEDYGDYTNYAGMPNEDDDEEPFPEVDDYSNADLDFENEYNDWLDDKEQETDSYPYDEFDDEIGDYDVEQGFDNPYYESRQKNGSSLKEETTVLNDFGKHPAYQKVVMTTPPNTDANINGYEDWNDDSVKTDKPFGIKIGSSKPFDEIVRIITDSVMKKLNSEQKKK